MAKVLAGVGHLCLVAPTADEARALLEEEHGIGLLIIDQNLGDESDSGLVLLGALRQTPKFQRIPVIVCTGDARTAVVTAFLGQRIAGFLRKPFHPERLVLDVQHALGHVVPPAPPAPLRVETRQTAPTAA